MLTIKCLNIKEWLLSILDMLNSFANDFMKIWEMV